MRLSIKYTLIFLSTVLYAELLSTCALGLLNISITVYPWYCLLLLKQGFYRELILASVFVSPVFIVIAFTLKTGIARFISFVILGFMAILVLDFFAGLLLFNLFDNHEIYLNHLLYFLSELKNDEAIASTFLTYQAISGVITLCIIAGVLYERYRPANRALGSARFGNGFDVYRAGFFKKENESIIIGKKLGAPLYSNGFEHVLVFASSGSGKTRSIGIPNLFNYPYSVVCNDVKLTMFKTTAGFREKVLGHTCYCFAPTNEDRKTHRFNPLAIISEDKQQRLTDIQRIAHILMPDSKKSDPIWQQASRKLFKVVVLYLLDTPEKPTTFGEINRLIKQQSFDDWLATTLEETTHLDENFYRNGFSYLNNHEKTRSSILETFSGYFELFDDPLIDAATSASDFDLRDLRRKKITIYIGFTDDDMERLSPLLTLFWQQLISAMIRQIPDPIDEPYPLLCLIDEFSSLGRIERLRRSLKLLREYRVRCILMLQYIAQTFEQYSHDEAKAFTNIKTKIAYTTDDFSDAEYISKLLGSRTIKVASSSVSSQAQGYSESKSYNYQATPLLRPEEVMRLPQSQSLIMRTGIAPIKAGQFIWYEEKIMQKLVGSTGCII